jgi:Cu2+-exporting ATPase
VLVARDGVAVAAAGLGDTLRDDARAAVDRLRSRGWRVELLSGDHADIALAVGRTLNLPPDAVRGGAAPEDKLAHVRAARQRGSVVMVGDGVNDAAALSAASVGVAVHGGAEAALAAADAYLSQPGLAPLLSLFDAAGRTMRTIRRTLIVSAGYNAIAATLALAGWINPLVAAVLMPISSLTALGLAIGGRTFGDDACP